MEILFYILIVSLLLTAIANLILDCIYKKKIKLKLIKKALKELENTEHKSSVIEIIKEILK